MRPVADDMRRKLTLGLALAVATVIVLTLGLLDPAVGSLALLLGGALILATWSVSRVRVPVVEIVAWGLALALGWGTVTAAAIHAVSGDTNSADDVPPWIWALFIGYEAAVAVTVGGAVWHLVRHVRQLRTTRPPG